MIKIKYAFPVIALMALAIGILSALLSAPC